VTLAILAARKGYLKVLGSFIQAACDRGHQVVLLHDPNERKPGEAATAADLARWPRAATRRHRRGAPLLPILKEVGATALVGPSLHSLLRAMGVEGEGPALTAAGIRLYSVDYVFDMVSSEPEGYRVVDVTCYMSEHQRQVHWAVQAERFAALGSEAERQARSAVVGSTMLDQLARVDRAAVRRKYGLPAQGPVVLFMSLKMAVPEPFRRLAWAGGWRGLRAAKAVVTGQAALVPTILRGNGYRDLARALQGFARRAGATLVVKSRAKNADPAFLRRRADLFVERDEDVFPYTSIELMAVADLCVHFQSGAVLEAAHANVPSLSIRVPQTHLESYASFGEVYGARLGSLQNFPGIVWSADAAEATRLLSTGSLADFPIDPAARRRYVEKFLGFDDNRSSERVLDLVEAGARLSPAAARGAAPPS
jgi:hypothetical protein